VNLARDVRPQANPLIKPLPLVARDARLDRPKAENGGAKIAGKALNGPGVIPDKGTMTAKNPQAAPEIEIYPDAWERFERAVKIVARHPAMHWEAEVPVKARRAKEIRPIIMP